MDRKLIGYLPPVLQKVLDFKIINEANEPEISLAWDALALVMANQFLEEADERGVSVWEQELKIHPKDTDTLAVRKARVKMMWNLKTPYTLPWLRDWMTGVFGADRHAERVDGYALTIQLWQDLSEDMSRKTEELLDMLSNVLPENLWLVMEHIFPTVTATVPIRAHLGMRLSGTALPLKERALPPARVVPAARLGWRMSITTLPMRAKEDQNGL